MAILYVTEFAGQGVDGYAHPINVAQQLPLQNQTVAISTSSTATATAFTNQTTLVRLHNDAGGPINFLFGTNPTAVANTSARMAANQTEYFTVPMGSGLKVAAITSAV